MIFFSSFIVKLITLHCTYYCTFTLLITFFTQVSKKLPSKSKSIEDIFAKKLSGDSTAESPKKNFAKQNKLNNEILLPREDKERHHEPSEATKVSPVETVPPIHKPQPYLEPEIEKKNTPTVAFQTSRSIFSPQPHVKDNEFLDFDILDDGFNISKDEEIMKVPLTFTFANLPLIKEDSKEDSARETLNLVEKLRMEMSKKSTSYDVDDSVSVASSTKNDSDKTDFNEQVVPNNVPLQKEVEASAKEIVEAVTEPPKEFPPEVEYNKYAAAVETPNENVMQAQMEERWAPPIENYPMQAVIDRQDDAATIGKNMSPVIDRRVSQTPFTEAGISMDCMPSPSPYANIHPQAKWAESEVMPIRRSSSSSAASTSSSCSQHRNDMEEEMALKRAPPPPPTPAEMLMLNHPGLEIPFGVLPPYASTMDAFPPFTDAPQFVSPVSLFPPPNLNAQLPFSSPGAAMYPPSFGAPFPSMMPQLPKPVVDDAAVHHFPSPCTAAFTSSQHNMALTAAMVNMPTPALKESDTASADVPALPTPVSTNSDASPVVNHVPPAKISVGKKSPNKPTRTSARFVSQQAKSPNKSPGKSPRQEVHAKQQNSVSRGRGESRRGARGRGRGRGRGARATAVQNAESADGIHNKLVGTVYDLDFDDDMSNENMTDLRAMRERRRSLDVHERKAEVAKEAVTVAAMTVDSPHKGHGKYNSDLRGLRPPTPQLDERMVEEPPQPPPLPPPMTFPDIVQPVLPGPVDMRTYNSNFDPHNYNEANNLLGAFATGTADSQVNSLFLFNFKSIFMCYN